MLGARDAAIARELTKIYESVRRGTLDELAGDARARRSRRRARSCCWSRRPAPARRTAEADLDARIEEALTAHSVKDAASVVSAATGRPRRQVYARALELAAEREQ